MVMVKEHEDYSDLFSEVKDSMEALPMPIGWYLEVWPMLISWLVEYSEVKDNLEAWSRPFGELYGDVPNANWLNYWSAAYVLTELTLLQVDLI